MSTNQLIEDLQKQAVASPLVELYEIEKPNGSYAYVTPGEDSDGSSLQLYDYTTNTTLRTYAPYPVVAGGFETKVTGPIARPSISFSNVGSNFTTLIGSTDIPLMVGKKIIRRLTLKKYLAGESADTGSGQQSVEFTRQVWTISKVKSRDAVEVSFELKAPFDLEGITIPARQIVANGCPWEYTGASPELTEANKCGGCTWRKDGVFRRSYGTSDNAQKVYVTLDDEYIYDDSLSYTDYTAAAGSTSFAVNDFIKTTDNAATEITTAGGFNNITNLTRYWQVRTAGTKTALGTPSESNSNFAVIRVFNSTYSASTTYKAYTDDRLNEIVKSGDFLWKTKQPTVGNAPAFSEFWRRADECGKRLESCNKRYGFNPITTTSATSRGKIALQDAILPFGGFPGSKNFE